MSRLMQLTAIFLTTLGIKAFSKNEQGVPTLTDEQTEKLVSLFGKEAVEKFKAALPKIKVEASNESEEAASEDDDSGIFEAVKNHLSGQAQKDLEETKKQLEDANKKAEKAEAEKKKLQEAVAKLSDEAETDPKPTGMKVIKGKEGVANVLKVNMGAEHYQAAANYLQTGMMATSNATIDVTEVKREFGTYLNSNGTNLEIIKQIFNGFTSAKYFKTVPATTEYRALQALINSVVQQFTPKWTPAGNTKFTPLVIPNRRHKINFPIIPAQVLDSYLFHLYDESLSPEQMPITKYIWENLLYPKILEDIEFRMIGKGKYDPAQWNNITEGSQGGTPEASMDGVETILVNEKAKGADSPINFFTLPASLAGFDYKTATAEKMLEFVESFVDWISPQYRNKAMNIYCSHEFYKRYKRAYKAVWGKDAGISGDFGSDKIDFSVQTLVPLDCLYGSPILYSTPAENQVKLRHKNDVPMVINDVQKINYEVRIFGEFWLAVGFAIGEAVFAYVPNGYNPQTLLLSTYGESEKFSDGTEPLTEEEIYVDMPEPAAASEGSGI